MKIKYFCPRWGSENLSWESFCLKAKNSGYDGIEAVIPLDAHEIVELKQCLKKYDLALIGQYYQSLEKDFELHRNQFMMHMEHIASLQPLLIDSQTGKDFYSEEQNNVLFKDAQSITERTGITIAHETHRNKALFAAHISAALLKSNPYVRITADFSHWCNVSESLLEQQEDNLNLAISRAIHIHARVGHSQSAQITDPRAPEWAGALQAHLTWWDAIVNSRISSGAHLLTITPEFGPSPYMQNLPYTGMPLADQWDINQYMMELLRVRYVNHQQLQQK